MKQAVKSRKQQPYTKKMIGRATKPVAPKLHIFFCQCQNGFGYPICWHKQAEQTPLAAKKYKTIGGSNTKFSIFATARPSKRLEAKASIASAISGISNALVIIFTKT
ncbi:hypothetical protein ABEV38_10955 [Parageobacillus thermoglucosidasius]|uniref:hypothetical protein n=1 Tax=Parageobacillus thermoglucosidasius TaxID=1426 RepID=UPI003D29E25E